MPTRPHDTTHTLPALDRGLTVLDTPTPRSAAFHELALNELQRRTGQARWVDARNVASTHALYARCPHPRSLRHLRIARAFTAYQHHTLVREVVRTTTGRTAFIAAPCVAALYTDDDLTPCERERFLAATLALLGQLARVAEIPILVSPGTRSASARERVFAAADRVIECEETEFGFRFDGEAFETTLYWDDGAWQTTIPYWVDLLGALDERERGWGVADPTTLDRFGCA
jgi:hypothetical protein